MRLGAKFSYIDVNLHTVGRRRGFRASFALLANQRYCVPHQIPSGIKIYDM